MVLALSWLVQGVAPVALGDSAGALAYADPATKLVLTTTPAATTPNPPAEFSSLAVVRPASGTYKSAASSSSTKVLFPIDPTSHGLLGSLRLGDGTYDVSCDCGANWTLPRARPKIITGVVPRAGGVDRTLCPKPNSYKVERVSRASTGLTAVGGDGDDDDDDDDGIGGFDPTDNTRPLNASEVVGFLPLPSQLRYANATTAFLSDIDGRATTAVLGTPGGDAGEFILGLQVYEDHLAKLMRPPPPSSPWRRRLRLRANATAFATTAAGSTNLTAGAVLALFRA